MTASSLVLSLLAVVAVSSQNADATDSRGQPVLPDCRVWLIEEAQVPGREAGVLVDLNIKEGDQVKQGDELGRIDDIKPAGMKKVKEKEFEAAKTQADDDINVRFAKAAAGVAYLAWQKAESSNQTSRGSVTEIELKRLELDYRKAKLQIEKSDLDMKVAKLTSEVKLAEVEAADAEIQLRRIVSPLDGVVVKVYKHVGEWVPPGDPVAHIMRVDRLKVEGFVSPDKYSPSQIDKQPVLVEAVLAQGRKVQFKGSIVFVSPQDQPGSGYLVKAEVDNRQENGHWLLRPGTTATMTIQTK